MFAALFYRAIVLVIVVIVVKVAAVADALLPFTVSRPASFRTGRSLLQSTTNFHTTHNREVDDCLNLNEDYRLGYNCSAYRLASPSPLPGCFLTTPAEPLLDNEGKQVVLVLEESGWLSQSLVNALFITMLEEGLGVTAVIHTTTQLIGAAAKRVSSGASHAVLEYWGASYQAQLQTYGQQINTEEIGYTGEVGLWVSRPAWDADPAGAWYSPDSYQGPDGVWRHLPRNQVANSIPSWTYSEEGIHAEALNCMEHFCKFGQYFPPQCQVDPLTRLTNCTEVYLENPEFSKGVYETLMTTYNMHTTGIYLGQQSDSVLRDMYSRGVPSLFYAYRPDVLLAEVQAHRLRFFKWFDANETFNAADPDPLTSTLFQDFPQTTEPDRLIKLWMKTEGLEDPYYQALAKVIRDFTVSNSQIEGMIQQYQANRLYKRSRVGSDIRAAACSYLASDSRLEEQLKSIVSQFEIEARPEEKRLGTSDQMKIGFILLIPVCLFLVKLLFLVLATFETQSSVSPTALRVFHFIFNHPLLALLAWYAWRYVVFEVIEKEDDRDHPKLINSYYILSSACFLYIAYFLARKALSLFLSFIRYLIRDVRDDETHTKVEFIGQIVIPTLISILKIAFIIAIAISIMQVTGTSQTVGVLLTSAIGFAIAFGLSETFKDYVLGISMLFSQLYRVGDWVTLNGIEGTVEKIDLRRTYVRGFNTYLYIINNREVSSNVIVNNQGNRKLRILVDFYISCDTDPGRIQAFIKEFQEKALTIDGVASCFEIYVPSLCSKGYNINGLLYTNHAPTDPQYSNLNRWGYSGIWWKPYLKTKSNISLMVGYLLRKHRLKIAGGLRVDPHTEPLPLNKIAEGQRGEYMDETFSKSTLRKSVIIQKDEILLEEVNANDAESTESISMFAISLDLQNKPLPSELEKLLPVPGQYDLVMVAVQGNAKYMPPHRDQDWIIFAHKRIPFNKHATQCHFDFLATIVNYFGHEYILLSNIERKGSGMAVLVRKSVSKSVKVLQTFRVASDPAATIPAHLVAISLQVCCTQMLLINMRLAKGGEAKTAQKLRRERLKVQRDMLLKLEELSPLKGCDPLSQFHSLVMCGPLLTTNESRDTGSMQSRRSDGSTSSQPWVIVEMDNDSRRETPKVSENHFEGIPEDLDSTGVYTSNGLVLKTGSTVSACVFNTIVGKSNIGSGHLQQEPVPEIQKIESMKIQPMSAAFRIYPHRESSGQGLTLCQRTEHLKLLKSQITEENHDWTLSFHMSSIEISDLQFEKQTKKDAARFYLTFQSLCLVEKPPVFKAALIWDKKRTVSIRSETVQLNQENTLQFQPETIPPLVTYFKTLDEVEYHFIVVSLYRYQGYRSNTLVGSCAIPFFEASITEDTMTQTRPLSLAGKQIGLLHGNLTVDKSRRHSRQASIIRRIVDGSSVTPMHLTL